MRPAKLGENPAKREQVALLVVGRSTAKAAAGVDVPGPAVLR